MISTEAGRANGLSQQKTRQHKVMRPKTLMMVTQSVSRLSLIRASRQSRFWWSIILRIIDPYSVNKQRGWCGREIPPVYSTNALHLAKTANYICLSWGRRPNRTRDIAVNSLCREGDEILATSLQANILRITTYAISLRICCMSTNPRLELPPSR